MTLAKIWELTDPELPSELHHVRDIFLPKQSTGNAQPVDNLEHRTVISDRGRNESLHDYLTRKNIKCFCRKCRDEIKRQSQANNLTLI